MFPLILSSRFSLSCCRQTHKYKSCCSHVEWKIFVECNLKKTFFFMKSSLQHRFLKTYNFYYVFAVFPKKEWRKCYLRQNSEFSWGCCVENSWKLRSQSRASSRRSSAGGIDVDCAGSCRPAFLRECWFWMKISSWFSWATLTEDFSLFIEHFPVLCVLSINCVIIKCFSVALKVSFVSAYCIMPWPFATNERPVQKAQLFDSLKTKSN